MNSKSLHNYAHQINNIIHLIGMNNLQTTNYPPFELG